MKTITEAEFAQRVRTTPAELEKAVPGLRFNAVTGPGRSGAIAAVYFSHALGIPFVPYGQPVPPGPLLIADTAQQSGATLRKAHNRYAKITDAPIFMLAVYNEAIEGRVRFWYERGARP